MDIYFVIVAFLLLLAVLDLVVGVSNDAVNFLSSAIGARVAKYNTVMIIAAIGIFVGASMSAGMMDVARHGIMQPEYFTFENVMCVFLSVMVTDVILLDIFNTMGMPTSTTVSMVFELLGGAFAIAVVHIADSSGTPREIFNIINSMLNGDKAVTCIVAIFLSVAVAFVFGVAVQWLARFLVTFHYGKVTSMILRTIVILGTGFLAFSFASNDLVNFIGVPMAALDSYNDFAANGGGDASGYMMNSLMGSTTVPRYYLVIAGIIMILALVFSKKARNVVETTIALSKKTDDDAERLEATDIARMIVRPVTSASRVITRCIPSSFQKVVNKRFTAAEISEDQAFDYLRACINLLTSATLVAFGTYLKLPLSTTYVMFMVAMGSSLADRAWGRESAVFRVTGVIEVIGGWFITAGAAFTMCLVITLLNYYGGAIVMVLVILLAIGFIIKSFISHGKDVDANPVELLYQKAIDENEDNTRWNSFVKYSRATMAETIAYTGQQTDIVIRAFLNGQYKHLRKAMKGITLNKHRYDRIFHRHFQMLLTLNSNLAGDNIVMIMAADNTLANVYRSLNHITTIAYKHVANDFPLVNKQYAESFTTVLEEVKDVFNDTAESVQNGNPDKIKAIKLQITSVQASLHTFRLDYADFLTTTVVPYATANAFMNIINETTDLMRYLDRMVKESEQLRTEENA